MRISTTCRISSSRPTIGSILPVRACSVKSTVNRFSASWPLDWPGIAPLASPGTAPPPTELPSLLSIDSSGEAATMLAKLSDSRSNLIFSNSREMPINVFRKVGVFKQPTMRWPVRTWFSPNIRVAKSQPRSTASSTWADRSEMLVAPRGSRSNASVKSLAILAGCKSNFLII